MTDKFTVKRATLDILEALTEKLEDLKRERTTEYGKTGEVQKKRRWNRETDQIEDVLDEDGNPVMEDVWGEVPKKPEDLTDYDKAYLTALGTIKQKLEGMI